MKRRHFLQQSALLTATVAPLTTVLQATGTEDFRFRFLVGSSMSGNFPPGHPARRPQNWCQSHRRLAPQAWQPAGTD
ncbi:MAG: hypothetical protein R3F31_10640 [Verrucomicrobiales bacterium]